MASVGEPDDSLFELHRQSLLDIVEDRNRALNKTKHKVKKYVLKALVHRVVIISKTYEGDFNEIGLSYEKLFKDLTNKFQCEAPTGLLLLYPSHCVHVVECSQDILIELIKDLRKDELSGEGKMQKSKIIVISHDIPNHIYQNWNYRILDIQAHNLDEYEPSEEAFKLVIEMLTQLLKLGSYINKQPKVALKNIMENLHEKVPELLPQQDVINFLLENDEEATVTPQEHLDKYQRPYDVTMDSELTWPMPVRLFPYN